MSSIVVRPLAGSAEYDAYFAMADQAFASEPSATSARFWQEFVTSMPTFRPELVRGAFRGETLLGGYTLFERQMHVGAAQVLTGCIGAVVTQVEQRKQGVGRALMQDCIAFAAAQHYALLLLDGIPDFYYRFGYTNVFDVSTHEINRAAILALPASAHTIRAATGDDAAVIVTLYEHAYGRENDDLSGWYIGSFVRSLERQQQVLQRRQADNPLLLAVDAAGQATGYLSLVGEAAPADASEVVANEWPSLLALMQHHAQRVAGTAAPMVLRYRLPPGSGMLYWLIQQLETPDKSTVWAGDAQPSEMWAVRTQTYHHRHAGWMARVVAVTALAEGMFAAWQARWNAALASWHGDITFAVADAHLVLHFDGEQLQLRRDAAPTGASVHMTPQALAQLIFGYRPISWIASQPDQEIPASVHAILDILFPVGHTWIPRSDWF